VADAVDTRRAYSREVAGAWRRPIRLPWLDGDHVYEAVKEDLALFRRHLVPGSILAMHDVLGTWEGPLRVFLEDVLGSDDFGRAGFCTSILVAYGIRRGGRPARRCRSDPGACIILW
jgi:hypothetical protein